MSEKINILWRKKGLQAETGLLNRVYSRFVVVYSLSITDLLITYAVVQSYSGTDETKVSHEELYHNNILLHCPLPEERTEIRAREEVAGVRNERWEVNGFYDWWDDSHFYDALRQVGWDLRQAFSPAVHNVVVAGAAGGTDGCLRSTGPRLWLSGACRARKRAENQQKFESDLIQRETRQENETMETWNSTSLWNWVHNITKSYIRTRSKMTRNAKSAKIIERHWASIVVSLFFLAA